MNKQKAANDFAKEHGWDRALYLKKYRGMACYEPISDAGQSCTGLPLVIMVGADGSTRLSTQEEAMQI